MIATLVIADIARAGNHAAVLGVAVVIAAVGGLVYLVRERRRSDRDHASGQSPEVGERSPEANERGRDE